VQKQFLPAWFQNVVYLVTTEASSSKAVLLVLTAHC